MGITLFNVCLPSSIPTTTSLFIPFPRYSNSHRKSHLQSNLYLGAFEELLLGMFEVLRLASPRCQYRRLQSAAEAERECPRLHSRVLVDSV